MAKANRDEKSDDSFRNRRPRRSGMWRLGLGIFIFLLGLAWLGRDLGWWTWSLPIFPLAALLVGLAFIVSGLRRHQQNS